MRQIPLKTLRATLTKELLDLPFEITSYGKVVGVVLKQWKIEMPGLNQSATEDTKGLNNKDKGLNDKVVIKKQKHYDTELHHTKYGTVEEWFSPQPKKGKK